MTDGENKSAELLATITIKPEDYRQIRKLYHEIRPDLKAQMTDAIKARDKDKHGQRVSQLLAIAAIFAKFSTQARDKRLIKDTFSLDDTDLAFLIGELAPADGGKDVTCTVEIEDNQHPELFPKTDEERKKDATIDTTLNAARGIWAHVHGKALIDRFAELATAPIAQGAGYNAFQYATEKNSLTDKNEKTKKLTMSRPKKSGLKVTLTNYNELVARWRPSAKKLLEYSVIRLTEQNHFPAGYLATERGEIDYKKDNPNINRVIRFSLDEWQRIQGRPQTKASEDEARERVKEDLQTILYTTLEWEEVTKRTTKKTKPVTVVNPDGTKTETRTETAPRHHRHWIGVNLATSAELKDNQIEVAISPEMANYLLNSYITQYPIGLLTLDDRNPNAYAIGRKLAEHYYNESNRRNDRNTLLSVAALLDCTDLPTPEYVKENDKGNYKGRIITPFIAALKATKKAIGLQWSFANAGGDPIRPDQQPESKIKDFCNVYILYSLPAEKTEKIPTPPNKEDTEK